MYNVVLAGEALMERLDKILSSAGIGSRKQIRQFVKDGRIRVNGMPVKAADLKVDPETDAILFDHQPVRTDRYHYYMLNKPRGVVSATQDNLHQTVMDLLPVSGRSCMFPVGRLDIDTEGMLLLTDNGQLSHRLLAPSRHVDKTYLVLSCGELSEDRQKAFSSGLSIGEDKPTAPAVIQVLQSQTAPEGTGILSVSLVTIREGRFHQIKRMFHAVGCEVLYLKRISMGPLTLDPALKPGHVRPLTEQELALLKPYLS